MSDGLTSHWRQVAWQVLLHLEVLSAAELEIRTDLHQGPLHVEPLHPVYFNIPGTHTVRANQFARLRRRVRACPCRQIRAFDASERLNTLEDFRTGQSDASLTSPQMSLLPDLARRT